MKEYTRQLYLVHTIMPNGQLRRYEDVLGKYKVGFHTTIPCLGTVNDKILNSLGVSSSHREYSQALITDSKLNEFVSELTEHLKLNKPGHGILFVTTVTEAFVTGMHCRVNLEENIKMEVLITAITNYGQSEDILEVARNNGAHGATIIKGHGTVSKEAEKFFGIAIEPEKEIVLFVVDKMIEAQVLEAIYEVGKFEKAGAGIVYSQPLSLTRGISSDSK